MTTDFPLVGTVVNLSTWGTHGQNVDRESVDLAVSCLDLVDPQRAARRMVDGQDLALHPGHHDITLSRVFEHDKFAKLLGELKAFTSTCRPTCSIGVFCRAGRHRSVAVGWFFMKILLQLGARVKVEHLEQNAGQWSHLCTGCPGCAHGTPAKERLGRQAFELFQRL